MEEEKKAPTWLSGKLTTENGDVFTFEFTLDPDTGGGEVRIAEPSGAPGPEIDRSARLCYQCTNI